MSAFARAFPAFGLPGLPAFAPARLARRVAAWVATRDSVWRERAAMRGLSDHTLRDIGIARAELDAMLRDPAGHLRLVRDRGDQLQH